ncbi:MAG TPA: hydantoinase/oxoprolinase family protein [Terriglobia bacterium]|nr:hydantoinase/oxoprolinase family protein [Terriglobia bacterium]
MPLIAAVDIGGTFTDFLGYDSATGQLFSSKTPTTPAGLEQGIHDCLEKAGVSVNAINAFVHGSTVAINIVLERKGARTALIVTRGTRDVYRIGRGNRPDAYDIWFKRPEPLVPRHLTFEVEERLLATGEVHTPLNTLQAETIARQVTASGVEAVAVCFLHSWNNPAHETQMAQLLNSKTYRSISHEILRQYGEYERISTTVLNSYIGPRVSAYLEGLERMLQNEGFAGSLWIMQSNGGVMSPSVSRRLPVAMLESGPVGGFIAAARTGAALGYNNVIGFDMGGTTAKANLARDGEPQMSHGYNIGGNASGQPMMLPVVDTVEVGSGGGSIARLDHTGSLKVGPVSAGADPGPACYGKGGTEATVTDANLLLGRLDPAWFLGGEIPLDVQGAREAINRCVARPLGLSETEAARAIVKIAVMNMSLAVRQVSVERGYDPRDFVMVGFGGAGPLHATEVARSLHIPLLVIPNFPAQFSAGGMLLAEPRHDFVRTYYRPLDQTDFGELGRIAADMEALARERMGVGDIRMRHSLEVRYTGQDFSLPIPVHPARYAEDYRATVRSAFHQVHQSRFGYHDADLALEIVNAHLVAVAPRTLDALPAPSKREGPALVERRAVIFDADPIDCPVYRRESLASGERIDGPAIIQEYASTTVLFAEDRAEVTVSGELLIRVGAPKGRGN